MSKKSMLKSYLRDQVDFDRLEYEWRNSWLYNKPHYWLYSNGLAHNAFNYKLCHEAIAYAKYAYPKSDRTWETLEVVKNELIDEIIFQYKGDGQNEN